jgi:hypothetical protein
MSKEYITMNLQKVPVEDRQALKVLAATMGITMAEAFSLAVNEYIKNREKKAK